MKTDTRMKTNEDGYLTKLEVARRFRRTPRTIEIWMRMGRLPFLRIGRSVLFHWPTVEQHMQQHFQVTPRPQRSALARARKKRLHELTDLLTVREEL